MKSLIKKYFTSFTFFYRYVGNRIFVLVVLSLIVSVLDGFGLAMFLPLLQMVSGDTSVKAEQLGSLSFIVDGAEAVGITMNLATVLFFMIAFFILKALASYSRLLYAVIINQAFVKDVRMTLLNALNNVNFKSFITSDAGQIQNTMGAEVDKVSNSFVTYFATFQQGIMVMVYISFAFFIDPQFAILVAVGGAMTNFLYKYMYAQTKFASKSLTGSSNVYQGLLIQHIVNFKYLRATNMEDIHSSRLVKRINEIEASKRRIGVLSALGAAVREPLLIIVVATVILIQVRVLGGGMGVLLISLLFFYRALSALIGMQESWNAFLGVSGSLENMQHFQNDLEIAKEENGIEKFSTFQKLIDCRNISFSFGKKSILKGINLQVPKNKSVAFVGESGSGKTTLVNVITGLLKVNGGQVMIDGCDIKQLNRKSYQRRIGYITQEAVIFNDSIYNNISFWAEKTPDNVLRFSKAVEQAALSEFINDLVDREETHLGNNGINVSGGQKQRISIARELFKEIDILIMDEATSALDSETEKMIQQSIEALQGKYTLIIVAHRLASVRNVDKIVYMHRGIVEAEGSFDQLLADVPKFKKMVELQEL